MYTFEQTKEMLSQAELYDDSTGTYRVLYVIGDNVHMILETVGADNHMEEYDIGDEVIFPISEIDLSREDVSLYKLQLMNPH